jgi:hypothetical protein
MLGADLDKGGLSETGGLADNGDSLIDDDLFDDEDRLEALEESGSSEEDEPAS